MNPQPTLLGLPRELRDEIYRHLNQDLCFTSIDGIFLHSTIDIIFPQGPVPNLLLTSHQLQAEYSTFWLLGIKKGIIKCTEPYYPGETEYPSRKNRTANPSSPSDLHRKNHALGVLGRIYTLDLVVSGPQIESFLTVYDLPNYVQNVLKRLCPQLASLRVALGTHYHSRGPGVHEDLEEEKRDHVGALEGLPERMGELVLQQRNRGLFETATAVFFIAVMAYVKAGKEGTGRERVTDEEGCLWTLDEANQVFGRMGGPCWTGIESCEFAWKEYEKVGRQVVFRPGRFV